MTIDKAKKYYKLKEGENREIVINNPGEYVIELLGERAAARVFGSFLLDQQKVETVRVFIRHAAAHTSAITTLKAAVTDQAKITLAGKIVIEKNCPDCQSFLAERVLLLSDAAKAETIPDLEIKSDEVKCSHAASLSRIDENQIFYLMSRGLTRAQAVQQIVTGFLQNK